MSDKSGGRGQRPIFTDQEALLFHSQGRPGKLEVVATKPMATQRDLSLAYSPGVAIPVLAIAEDEDRDVTEVADILKIDAQTVRSTHHKALLRLREHFKIDST